MAKFGWAPHPKMMEILAANNGKLKMAIPLTDFLHALKQQEYGYMWKDLIPDGVSHLEWYSLLEAYRADEAEIHRKREEEDYFKNLEEMKENGWQTAEVNRVERDRIIDLGGHIEF